MKLVHFLKPTEFNKEKPLYECYVCDKLFNWHDDAFWYGSLKQLDFNQGNHILHFCSSECKSKHEKKLGKSS